MKAAAPLPHSKKYGRIHGQMAHSIKNIRQMRTVAGVCGKNDFCTELIKGISQYAHARHNFILRHFPPRYIDEGRLSMKEIAARTGFANQSYFTNVYKKYYGHPPSKR